MKCDNFWYIECMKPRASVVLKIKSFSVLVLTFYVSKAVGCKELTVVEKREKSNEDEEKRIFY